VAYKQDRVGVGVSQSTLTLAHIHWYGFDGIQHGSQKVVGETDEVGSIVADSLLGEVGHLVGVDFVIFLAQRGSLFDERLECCTQIRTTQQLAEDGEDFRGDRVAAKERRWVDYRELAAATPAAAATVVGVATACRVRLVARETRAWCANGT